MHKASFTSLGSCKVVNSTLTQFSAHSISVFYVCLFKFINHSNNYSYIVLLINLTSLYKWIIPMIVQ